MEVNLTSIETTLRDIMLTKVGQALKSASSGIEMEEGSFTAPSPKVSDYSVVFANEHTKEPNLVVALLDAAEEYVEADYTVNDVHGFIYNYWGGYIDCPWATATLKLYGNVNMLWYSTSNTPRVANTHIVLYFPFVEEEVGVTTIATHPAYYVNKNGFKITNPITTKYLQAGSKYNWCAFWLPEKESEVE